MTWSVGGAYPTISPALWQTSWAVPADVTELGRPSPAAAVHEDLYGDDELEDP